MYFEGNVAIVDTPGIGDIDQKEVAEETMDYLPNALAFVFVINVAAAGGLQKDRFIPIMEHVKNSLKGMVSFDHDDVIFLLNKWDTLLDDDEKDTFFESSKKHISNIWKEVKPDRILKLSMNKAFKDHASLFQCFSGELEDVIEKNKEKRLKVHVRFLRYFIDECDNIVSPQLKRAQETSKTSQDKFEEALSRVSDLKKIWQEETLKVDENVNRFLDAVTHQLHGYIHHPDFKNRIIKNVETSWRLNIRFNVNAQIAIETNKWEKTHVKQIYTEMFVKNLNGKLKTICGPLAENLMRGFEMPYDPDMILFGFFSGAVSIVGGIAITGTLCDPPAAAGVAAAGTLLAGLVKFGYIRSFKTVRENAVNVRINKLSKTLLKQDLKKRYDAVLKKKVKEALEKMKIEIDKLTEEQKEKETENTINTSKMHILMSLDDMVFKCKQRLLQI